jgi:hypothetical protein
LSDVRIRWNTTLQVNINEDGKTAEIEGFIVVDNQTGFTYENVELGFAIFELPQTPSNIADYQSNVPPLNLRQEMMSEMGSLKNIQKGPMKRTQRFKQLL